MTAEARIELIRLLSDGHWHSGQDLAQQLGITRAAVWQRMQGLHEWGLVLHSVRGRGYQLPQPLELLDTTCIQEHLPPDIRARLSSIDLFPVLDSTNAWLMAQSNGADIRLCQAEYQSAGRGRRGRDWQSPFGANLYLSLAWRFKEMPAQFSALGLVAGVALTEALMALGAQGIGIKWPNDLLWQGRKLAGILVEHRGEGGGPARVVIGIGLNVSMTENQARQIGQPWTTLDEIFHAQHAVRPGRNVLTARVVEALIRALDRFTASGLAAFVAQWARLDLACGQLVKLEHDGQLIHGTGRGIDTDGGLILEVDGRRERYLSGDVSLRLAGGT